MQVQTTAKAGAIEINNHNATVAVRSGVKGGSLTMTHTQAVAWTGFV